MMVCGKYVYNIYVLNNVELYEELWRQELQLIKWLKLTRGHNSGKKQSGVTSV